MNSVMFSLFHRILDISSVMTTLTFRKSWMVIRCSASRSKLEKLAHFAHETLLVSAFRRKGLFRINLLLSSITGWEHAFLKQTWQAVDSFDTPYDYNSIMHYRLNAFSRSRRRKTIIPLKKDAHKVRPYRKISKIDAIQVKRMYNCDGKTFLALKQIGI